MYSKYFGCDPLKSQQIEKPDQLVPYFIYSIVGHIPGLTGLFVSCVFSAGLSTMSANLNSLAGILYEDCVKAKVQHTDRRANLIMKLIILLFGIYCLLMGFVMEFFGSILQLVLLVLSVTNGTTLGVYLLGMFYPYANRFGALWASVISTFSVGGLLIYSQLNIFSGRSPIPNQLHTSVDQCNRTDNLLLLSANV